MRKSAQVAASVLSLGVLALSYKVGIDQPAAASTNSFSTNAAIQTSSFVKTPKAAGAAVVSPAPVTPVAPKPVVKTATGTLVNYAFGQVQVKATKTDGKLTAITYVKSTASRSRQAAFPYLVQYALQYQGANFGNLGGATYTTNAFKQSLTAALAKL